MTPEHDGDGFQHCAFCGGDLEERSITNTTEHEGHVVVVANVPAFVCRQCGERAFRPEAVEKLQRIVWGQAKPSKPIEVDSYDFAEVA